jgi:hypothetical protein
MLASIGNIVDALKPKFGVTADSLTDEAYEDAANSALRELGWAIPVAHSLKEYWVLERAVRHSIFILMIEAARKFRYKQIHLQNRFEHYNKILILMDEKFEAAKAGDPDLFISAIPVDPDTLCRWITYIPNAREYNMIGQYATE